MLSARLYTYKNEFVDLEKKTALGFAMLFMETPSKIHTLKNCKINGIVASRGEFLQYFLSKLKTEVPSIENILRDQQLVDIYGIENKKTHLNVTLAPNQDEFDKLFELLYKYPLTTLYHGSSIKNISSILRKSIKPSKRGSLGPGIYLANLGKAKSFAERYGSFYNVNGYLGMVAVCDVLIGNCIDITSYINRNDFNLNKVSLSMINENLSEKDKFNSIYYTGFVRPEYCIGNKDQVLLKKIIINNPFEKFFNGISI